MGHSQTILHELEEFEVKWESIVYVHEVNLMLMSFNPSSIEQSKLLISRKMGMKKSAKIVTIIRSLKQFDSKEIDYQILLCELVTAEINEKIIQARVNEAKLKTEWDNAIVESIDLALKLRNINTQNNDEDIDEQELSQTYKISVDIVVETSAKLVQAENIVKTWEESNNTAETAILAWKSFVNSTTTLSSLHNVQGDSELIRVVTEKNYKIIKNG